MNFLIYPTGSNFIIAAINHVYTVTLYFCEAKKANIFYNIANVYCISENSINTLIYKKL